MQTVNGSTNASCRPTPRQPRANVTGCCPPRMPTYDEHLYNRKSNIFRRYANHYESGLVIVASQNGYNFERIQLKIYLLSQSSNVILVTQNVFSRLFMNQYG